jgi:hypothetical protein
MKKLTMVTFALLLMLAFGAQVFAEGTTTRGMGGTPGAGTGTGTFDDATTDFGTTGTRGGTGTFGANRDNGFGTTGYGTTGTGTGTGTGTNGFGNNDNNNFRATAADDGADWGWLGLLGLLGLAGMFGKNKNGQQGR